ncbi:MAG: twin-arginine translocase TatA/TatE family subunit [Armatimonadota bacterium]|nr:twin-arginine translocase TatA/TatE family subunit [Armatimonadota bacterium]
MFGSFGYGELALILVIVLVLFGGKKIPEIMRGIGEGLREFRKASSEAQSEIKRLAEEPLEEEQADVIDAEVEEDTGEETSAGAKEST